MSRTREGEGKGRPGAGRSSRLWLVALAVSALSLSACSLHVSKNGVSGNVFGHSFSAAKGTLPSGFPSSVPTPDDSRVLAGGGTSDRWDVAFAVKGPLAAGTTAYLDKFTAAGYTVTAATAAPSGSTTTTVTVSGSSFQAADGQWTVEVVSGSTTSSTDGTLRAGEFAINITVVPTSSTTTTS